ncbi:hypothetical protein Dimus_019299 [Dionaea muscipula]
MTSCIHVDLIPVDIGSGARTDTSESCNHFSIRGYVAEVRKRDKKLCFPFCADDGYSESLVNSYELPPLEVPKFRWWECHGCLRESGSQKKSREVLNLQNGMSTDPNCIPTSSRRLDVATGPVLPLKDYGQTSQVKTRGRQKREPGASSVSRDNKNCTSFCIDPRGKAFEYGMDNKSYQETLQSTSEVVQLDVLLQDQQDDDSVAVGSELNHVIVSPLQISGSKGVGEAGLAGEMSKNMNAPGVCQSGGQASADGQKRDLMMTRVDADVPDHIDNATRGRLVPLPDLNICDDGTLDNDKEILVNNPHDDDEDDLSGSSRPKTRKIRFLSELLGVRECRNVERVTKGDPSLVGSFDRSTRKDLLLNGQRKALIENGSPHIGGQKRRRISSNDGGHRPIEIKGSGEGTKRFRTVSVDKENTLQSADDSDTESEGDASRGIVSQSVAKSSYSLVRNHELEKKAKKAKGENGGSSMSFKQKAAAKVTVIKTLSADKISSAADGSQRMDPLVNSHVIVQRTEESPTTFKRKKAHQSINDQTLLIPRNSFAPRECSAVKHCETQPRKNISAGKAVHHFPESCLFVENEKTHFFSDEDGLCLPSALQGLKIVDDDPLVGKVSENRDARSRTHFNAAALASPIDGRFEIDRVRSANQKSILKGKEKMFPEFETGDLPWSENMVSPGIKRNGMAAEERGLRQDIDINTIPTNDKVPEQRPPDDIPMDIVELMAKHQHERQGSFEKHNHFMFPPKSYTNNAMPYDSSCTNISYGLRPVGIPNSWQDNLPCMQRPLVSSARNGTLTRFCDPVSIKQKCSVGPFPEVDQTYLNTGHSKESTHSSGRFDGSARHNEHMYSDLRLSSVAFNWNGRTPAQRSLHGSVQGLEPLNKCVSPSQHNPGNHVWAPVMPKCGPQGSGNEGIVSQSSGKQKVHEEHHGHFNLDGFSRLWKQKANSELQAQYSSAVQLLKMMHSGERKPPSNHVEGSSEILRWPGLHPDQPYNQYPAVSHNFSLRGHNPGGNYSNSSRHPSHSHNDGTNSFPQKLPHPCYSGIPNGNAAGSFASSFHNEAGAGRSPAAITNHVSFASRAQTKKAINSLQVSAHGGNLNLHPIQTIPSWDDGGRNKHVSAIGKGKGIMDVTSGSAIPPLHGTKDLTSCQKKAETRGVILPTPQTDVCLVNKNPAELDLSLARKFVIEGEKLRPVKWCGENSSQAKASAKRAERIRHLAASKERERQRKS